MIQGTGYLFLTADGKVKILDFGLARQLAEEPEPGAADSDKTMTLQTSPGAMLGTAE